MPRPESTSAALVFATTVIKPAENTRTIKAQVRRGLAPCRASVLSGPTCILCPSPRQRVPPEGGGAAPWGSSCGGTGARGLPAACEVATSSVLRGSSLLCAPGPGPGLHAGALPAAAHTVEKPKLPPPLHPCPHLSPKGAPAGHHGDTLTRWRRPDGGCHQPWASTVHVLGCKRDPDASETLVPHLGDRGAIPQSWGQGSHPTHPTSDPRQIPPCSPSEKCESAWEAPTALRLPAGPVSLLEPDIRA